MRGDAKPVTAFPTECRGGRTARSASALERILAPHGVAVEISASGSRISGHELADRFVMGGLRACAEVVLMGAGTLRATPGYRWTPGYVRGR